MDGMGREAMGKRPFRERENGSPLGWQAVFFVSLFGYALLCISLSYGGSS